MCLLVLLAIDSGSVVCVSEIDIDNRQAGGISRLCSRWATVCTRREMSLSCTHNEWRTLGLIILKTLDISIGGADALRSRLCFHRHHTDVHTGALENCIWLTTRAPAAAQISMSIMCTILKLRWLRLSGEGDGLRMWRLVVWSSQLACWKSL